jgi:hypothetical protein
MTIALWIGQLAVAGILGMGAFMKFFNYTPEGSMALADAMGVGRGVVTMIGLVETAALVLILIPRAHAIGATKIGWSGNAAAEGWPLALVVLVAASFVLMVRRKELPIVGQKL